MAKETDVLFVDDNQSDVKLALYAIHYEELPHTFKVFRDGEDALNYLRCRGPYADRPASPPKLVLLDLNLPKVGGFEVLRTIKTDPIMKTIPVVVLSSSGQVGDMQMSYALGANSYIQKPANLEAFRTVMGRIKSYWLEINQVAPVQEQDLRARETA
jgi:two-component system response regulator